MQRVDHGSEKGLATRDYPTIADQTRRAIETPSDLTRRMGLVVDTLWDHLHRLGVSWVGFYLKDAQHDQLVLGPSRDKPACSPIGLQGACGQSFLSNKPLIVEDVTKLGAHYIACDPRDRSEVVLPFYGDGSTTPRGVLDLDSYEVGSFDQSDVEGLSLVLQAADLAPPV